MTSDNTSNIEFAQPPAEEETAPAPAAQPERGKAAGAVASGAGAVVAAGLGLASILGTPLADMMRFRQELIGQIDAATGVVGDEIESIYSAPWNSAVLVNGIFAVVAIVLGTLLLGVFARRTEHTWVKAVALSGVVLGVIGLFLAGGMYLDVLAPAPELPPMPTMPMGG